MTDRNLQVSMYEAFSQSRFSKITTDELPISIEIVREAVGKSPEKLEVDAWAFAIMAGNLEPIFQMYENEWSPCLKRVGEIFPFHLAASFMDGGHTCCLVMHGLICLLQESFPITLNNVDANGHTVLDSLMISILRSHTDLAPFEVSESFRQSTRFPGEEKDICGRWDVDTPPIRQLYNAGNPRIPKHWKHCFCHSAAQAVCHNIIAVFGPASAPDVDAPSGLFRRCCANCGLELKLGPLHTLIIVAFYLSERGMDGETLFGVVSCLACLLALGANANLTVDVSVEELLGSPDNQGCRHQPVDALQLAQQIPRSNIDRWSLSCKCGWRCLLLILGRATIGLAKEPSTSAKQIDDVCGSILNGGALEENDVMDETWGNADGLSEVSVNECRARGNHDFFGIPCQETDIGILWATVQTELLTYRKISNLDPNISDNFRLAALERWLEGSTEWFETPLVEDEIMKEHSKCGWFVDSQQFFNPMASETCSRQCMNLDVPSRASFIELLGPYDGEFLMS